MITFRWAAVFGLIGHSSDEIPGSLAAYRQRINDSGHLGVVRSQVVDVVDVWGPTCSAAGQGLSFWAATESLVAVWRRSSRGDVYASRS